MHSVLETFQTDAEQILKEFVSEAKLYFKDDEAGYFAWLQKASFLKFHKPDISNAELLPKTLDRSSDQAFKEMINK